MKAIWKIYIEGFGQRAQQVISYNDRYHQDDGQWLKYCEANEKRLKDMYYDLTVNKKSTQDFFGDWCHIEGYSDIGYYLGSKWMDKLHKDFTFEEIAKLDLEEINKEFERYFGR